MSDKVDSIYYHIRPPKDYKDFWELNQGFSFLEPFAEFKKKKLSAKVMTAIYMIYDPKSQLVNSGESEDKIKKDVSKNFLGNDKFDWTPFMKYVRAYKSYSKTKVEKALDDWWRQLQERRVFLEEDMEWEDDPEKKDKLMLNTKQHFDNFNLIKSTLKQ